VSPYAYRKVRHARTEHPAQNRDYRAYKPVLRLEFREKCVYCCAPDQGRLDGYGVDHYRPKSLFPDLAQLYENLFYSCNGCNARKGRFWPSASDEKAGRFIPNPCDHTMFGHLRFREAVVEAKSAAGEFTLKLLDLNSPTVVKFREAIIMALSAFHFKRQEALATLQQLVKLRGESAEAESIDLEAAIAKLQGDIEQLTTHARTLAGA
jgi:hypothetical protein